MLPSAVTAQTVWGERASVEATIRRETVREKQTERARQREKDAGKKKVYILRSTCSTILPQPSSMHIQLRYKVQPAGVCLQRASIMDGFVCMCVVGEWAGGGGGRRRRCHCEWNHSPKMFSPLFSLSSFTTTLLAFCTIVPFILSLSSVFFHLRYEPIWPKVYGHPLSIQMEMFLFLLDLR